MSGACPLILFQFVDLVKENARFQQIGSAPALTFDSAGWPQSDFEYIFLDDRRNMPWDGPDFNGVHRNDAGIYHLTFTGQATLVAEDDPGALQFQHVTYNSATNTTTADVALLPNHWLAAIGFTKTQRKPGDMPGNGITNVSLLRPGYKLGTKQIFTTDFLNALSQLHPTHFRSFDNGINSYNIWNGTTLVDVKWADRSLPSDAYWSLASRNSGAARGLAVPWEFYIMLANETNAGLWINLPVGADDDYVTQLAKLLKKGKFNNAPNHYLYGIGEAPYVDPIEHGTAPYPDPADPNGVNRIMDTFYTAAGNRRRAFEQWQAVAVNFGLHEVGYESGPSLNAGIDGDVARSPRMADFEKRYYLNDYFATGADAVNFFALRPGYPCSCGDWYAFEDYRTMNSFGKWLGILGASGQARPGVVVGNVLPWSANASVIIDARQYVNGGTFSAPGSTAKGCVGGCWPTPGALDYLLRVPAGTYALQLAGHSDNAAAQIQVQVDNATITTIALPQNSDGTARLAR